MRNGRRYDVVTGGDPLLIISGMRCSESGRVHAQCLTSARGCGGRSARKKIGVGIVSKESLQETVALGVPANDRGGHRAEEASARNYKARSARKTTGMGIVSKESLRETIGLGVLAKRQEVPTK